MVSKLPEWMDRKRIRENKIQEEASYASVSAQIESSDRLFSLGFGEQAFPALDQLFQEESWSRNGVLRMHRIENAAHSWLEEDIMMMTRWFGLPERLHVTENMKDNGPRHIIALIRFESLAAVHWELTASVDRTAAMKMEWSSMEGTFQYNSSEPYSGVSAAPEVDIASCIHFAWPAGEGFKEREAVRQLISERTGEWT
ncbi:hypothetical protein [Jeotgalibacillus soli]|uniref:Uncharacterized protein n=1 Tax=Jeotgalibacillus soli TaxID=889306 RepID=A0A0C2VLQ9_9BACL|nr:hypothetical protein [Jeotgalibacillus soli]KIL49857.1 hypothetical protein KP78_13250 [Jeotgalibacillus soli]